jgi:hypothetical protein
LEEEIIATEPVDKFSIESLRAGIPQDQEQIANAKIILLENLYKSGRIYNEELEEKGLAIEQFERVLSYKIEDKHVLLSAFELYRLNEGINPNKQSFYGQFIKENYPQSDYAKYIDDPNYFVKKREREILDIEDYEALVASFREGRYPLVRSRASRIIQNEPMNAFRSGYMLLHAMADAGMNKEKREAIPLFEAVIEEFPNSKEAIHAQVLVDIINNGYSQDIKADFGSDKSEFQFRADKMMFIIIGNEGDKMSSISNDISNFNKEFFGDLKLKPTTSFLGQNKSVVQVATFRNQADAEKYLNGFKKARRTVKHLQTHTFFIITIENYQKLLMSGDIEGYLQFYNEFYN